MNKGIKDILEGEREVKGFATTNSPSARRFRCRSASNGGRAGRTGHHHREGFRAPFGAIGHQGLASESKAVQGSRTIIFAGLALTGLTAGVFFDN